MYVETSAVFLDVDSTLQDVQNGQRHRLAVCLARGIPSDPLCPDTPPMRETHAALHVPTRE